MRSGRLTVIGDLLEDVVVHTSGGLRWGTDNPATITRSRGGSGANVAALAAGSMASRFIGRVGDDPAGSTLVAQLESCGVEVLVQRSGRTGAVVVLVDDDGERTMFPDRAAAAELSSVPVEWLAGTDVLHVPAYGFANATTAVALHEAIGAARRAGARVSIDVSATSLIAAVGVAEFRSSLVDIRPDVVFANADEAALLDITVGGHRIPEATIVIKRGPRPATVIRDGEVLASVPAVAVDDVVDATGAGDAFAAGFLPIWSAGGDPADACVAGHVLAASVIVVPGAGSAANLRRTR